MLAMLNWRGVQACRNRHFPDLLFTLLSLGYLHLDEETGRYFLHPHVLTLGYPVLSQLSIRELARPLMQELADKVKGAVVLGVRDGLSIIIVERARHRTMATWPLDIGVARDISTTALGRAYIVALQQDARTELLDRIRGMTLPVGAKLNEGSIIHFSRTRSMATRFLQGIGCLNSARLGCQ